MLDVSQLVHDHNMASEQQPKPPSYPPSSLDQHQHQQPQPPLQEVHSHWHQTTTPEPSRKPWHRRRGCVAAVGLASVFALIGISVGIALAVVYVLKNRDRGRHGEVMDSVTGLMTTTTEISTTSSTSSTSSEITSELHTTIMTPLESTVTIIITASESSEAIETETATLTVTASDEEDLGAILSSVLSDFPRLSISTEVVTVSVTPTQPTTTSTTSTTTSSSSSSSSTTTTIISSSVVPSSTTAATTSTTSSTPPSLATDSNLAAVDVQSGPSKLHRRLVIWQDEYANLIASDSGSASGPDAVYPIANFSNAALPSAQHSTPLTATADSSGAVHLFYLADDGSVAHLIQQGAASWTSQKQSIQPRSKSSLSATWHQGNTSVGAVVLAYQGSDGSVLLFYGADVPESDDSTVLVNISNVLDLNTGDWDDLGLAVTSARAMDAEGGGRASLQILVEGRDDVLTAECLIDPAEDGKTEPDCYWLTSAFIDKKGNPISIASHPTYLSWSTHQSTSTDSPPATRGFFTLESKGLVLTDHQLVPDESSKMVSYEITKGSNVESIVMTTSGTLFARIEQKVWQFMFDQNVDNWVTGDEVDTRLTG